MRLALCDNHMFTPPILDSSTKAREDEKRTWSHVRLQRVYQIQATHFNLIARIWWDDLCFNKTSHSERFYSFLFLHLLACYVCIWIRVEEGESNICFALHFVTHFQSTCHREKKKRPVGRINMTALDDLMKASLSWNVDMLAQIVKPFVDDEFNMCCITWNRSDIVVEMDHVKGILSLLIKRARRACFLNQWTSSPRYPLWMTCECWQHRNYHFIETYLECNVSIWTWQERMKVNGYMSFSSCSILSYSHYSLTAVFYRMRCLCVWISPFELWYCIAMSTFFILLLDIVSDCNHQEEEWISNCLII